MILEVSAGSSWLVRSAAALVLGMHITAGIVGIAAGATALVVRKGSPLHRRAGTWFILSMLAMAGIGAAVSPFLPRPNWGNVVAGVFTLYLVATSWVTIRRTDGRAGPFDVAAFLVALGVVATDVTLGVMAANRVTESPDGTPIAAYFIFGAAAALAAVGDLRVIVRRGIQGTERVTRHLWRMSTALLIAAFSFFLGQPQVFPAFLRGSPLLFVPEIAVLGSIIFWLIRVRVGDRFKREATARAALVPKAL